MTGDPVLAGYAAAAEGLIEGYEAIDPGVLYAPVAALLPGAGAEVLDVGAGTGRDAAWLARRGCRVLAVEPVAAFREAGQRIHGADGVAWLEDRLPELGRVCALEQRFGFILVSGVWQHLDGAARAAAMPVLAGLMAPGGRMVLSLRHGPGAPGRPVWPVPVAETLALAGASGLGVLERVETSSIGAANRAAGVTWTWLVLEAG